jgi:predicted small lipoprotein YifL
MRLLRFSIFLTALLSLGACGNKGDLVRPTTPATQQQPATPPEATPSPVQDTEGH